MEDQAGRVYFAGVLSDELQIHIDLRGTKQREDVIALARAALSVPEGERVLTEVVRVFEGAPAATELERLLAPGGAPPGVECSLLSGPLTQRDVHSALALLGNLDGTLSVLGLRDRLAGELHLDLPLERSAVDLFGYVMELNVQPDGLPPAVLFMDHAAALTGETGRRQALSMWADTWAQRAGLLRQLEHRRAERAVAVVDPTIPRCLVVAVEPARDGSGDIVVRPWLNTVPGRWQPQPGEPETTSLDGLGEAVEQALRQVLRLFHPSTGRPTEPEPTPPYVEFLLPYDLLNHDVAGLRFRSGDGKPQSLGLKYGVHLRSLERMRTDDVLVRAQWLERWSRLHNQGIAVHGWRSSDTADLEEWQAALAGEPTRTAAVLDAPDGGAATEALKAAIAEGIGLAVWDRRGRFLEERREVVTAVFASVPTPAQLPGAVHRLRRTAELNAARPLLLGRHIAFLWDDPNRLVDVHTAADYGLGQYGGPHPIDSEETAV
ncbi:VMAP-C domain-containing protein [Streptomyces sp. NPDC002405]